MPESHSRGKDAGTDTVDLDLGLIYSQGIAGTVIVFVDEGFDADDSGLAVVCDLHRRSSSMRRAYKNLKRIIGLNS